MADQAPAEPSKNALKKAEKQKKMAAEKAAKASKQTTVAVGQGKKTEDVFGIVAKKDEDFPSWYQEVVLKAEMIEYYNEVSHETTRPHSFGCSTILTHDNRFLDSSSCARQACISGMSFESGSSRGLRIWALRRPVSPCSSHQNPWRKRRVGKLDFNFYWIVY